MSTVLPDGLLKICCEKLSVSFEDDHHEIKLLHFLSLGQFWKVSSARNRYTHSSATARAENIFWRLWNDPIHRESIGEIGIAQICDLCTQPVDLAPFQLSMPQKITAKEGLSFRDQTCQIDSTLSSRSGFDSSRETDDKLSSVSGVDYERLRKSSNDVEVRSSVSAAVSRPKTSRSTSFRNSSTRINVNPRENPLTTTTSGVKSRRPVLGRRKNSSAISQNPKPPKSPALNTRPSHQDEATSVAHARETAFELPSPSSWEDESSTSGSLPRNSVINPDEQAELNIDPDFRNKFAEKVASYSSLALAGRMRKTGSVVRFAASPDQDPKGTDDFNVDRQSSLPFGQSDRPPLFHRRSTSSVVVIDGETEEDGELSPNIPRTKSQLSFLISERRATEGEDLLKTQPEEEKRKNNPKKSEDDEVLAMAQRQGVTKAGGIQVPQSHRVNRDIESRYSSPDRDLIF